MTTARINVAPVPAAGVIVTPDLVPVQWVADDVLDRLIGALLDCGADPEGLDAATLCAALTGQLSAASWDGERWAVEAFTVTTPDGVTSVELLVEDEPGLGRVLLFGVRN